MDHRGDQGADVKAGEAFGWALTCLINDHIVVWSDHEDEANDTLDFHPEQCGGCAALAECFLTPQGRIVVDMFVRQVPKDGQGEDWRNPDGTVNWAVIDRQLALPKKEEK